MRQKTALIAGAGIAGPAAAYWLNAAGWRTTIVERAAVPRAGGYVIDFWGLGYDIAERMGLSADIESAGYHVRELKVVGDQGQRLAGFGTSVFEELTGGRYITIARSDLARLLIDATSRETELLFGDRIIELTQDADGVDVNFVGGMRRRFDLVIGADGLHSGVRKLAFGPEQRFEKSLGYAVAAFEVSGYRPRDPDSYLMYTVPGRMLGRFALHDDRTLFLLVFSCDDKLPAGRNEQIALIKNEYRNSGWETDRVLGLIDSADEIYLDNVSQIIMPAWSKGRTVLVGDAAFCVSLLAGQGSALAIIAAYVLAGEIALTGDDIAAGLASYEKRLRSYIATKQAGAVRFAGAFAPRTPFGIWFRNMVVRSLAIPGLAKFVVGREIIDRLVLPAYGFSLGSDRSAGSAAAGKSRQTLAAHQPSRIDV